MNKPKWIFTDGSWIEADRPLLTVDSRAVSYGDGCFETLRSHSGKFLHFERHLERLRRGLEYLSITRPSGLEDDALKNTISELLERNGKIDTDCVVRIQVWRDGDRGFNVSKDAASHYAVTSAPLPDIPESVKLATVPTRRIPSEAVNPGFKLSNGINYIRAATEAADRGADDALMLSLEGFVAETTIANIFWATGDAVFTPSAACDILPGITRETVIEIIKKELDVDVNVGSFTIEHLAESETVWVCNSVRELVPVQSVDRQDFSVSHPVLDRIDALFQSYKSKVIA